METGDGQRHEGCPVRLGIVRGRGSAKRDRGGAAAGHSYANVVRAFIRQLEAACAGSERNSPLAARVPTHRNTHCQEEGVRLSVIGRRDRIPATLRQAIVDAEAVTAHGKRLHLRLAIDYSAREAIYQAACRFYKATQLSPEAFADVLSEVLRGGSTEVDLLIRTGGEHRLFRLSVVECAFAEFVFLQKRCRNLFRRTWKRQ